MNNQELIEKAIDILKRLEPDKLETVNIRSGHYSDGSKSLEIEIAWPELDKKNIK